MPFRFPRLTPTVKKLLILLGASFVIVAVVQNLASVPVFQYLALDLASVHEGSFVQLAWQPLTHWLVYPPVPGALLDFAFILLGIYFFLCPFEEAYGAKRALHLAAAGVFASALASILAAFVLTPPAFMAGASAVSLAALGAFPVIARGAQIQFMFVVPMKAWHVVLLGLAIAALSAVLARNAFVFIEHAAALMAGVGYASWMTRPRKQKMPKKPPKKPKSGPDLRVVRGGADDDGPRWLN